MKKIMISLALILLLTACGQSEEISLLKNKLMRKEEEQSGVREKIIVEEDKREEESYKQAVAFIVQENQEMISDFLENHPADIKFFDVLFFDFTGDGQKEIILSRTFVQTLTTLDYNYVYDISGEKVFEFITVGGFEIYEDTENKMLYLCSAGNYGTRSFIQMYGEINQGNMMEYQLEFVEWDTRDGRAQNADEPEGYYIFEDFSQEEQLLMGESYESLLRVFESKEDTDNREELENYKEIFSTMESQKLEWGGAVLGEEGRIVWEVEGTQVMVF